MWSAIIAFGTWLLGKLFAKPDTTKTAQALGAEQVKAETAEDQAKTEAAIATAEAAAPATVAATISTLNRGAF